MEIEKVVLHKDYKMTEKEAYHDMAIITLKPNPCKKISLYSKNSRHFLTFDYSHWKGVLWKI